jgi:hypothetical protein
VNVSVPATRTSFIPVSSAIVSADLAPERWDANAHLAESPGTGDNAH